MPTCGSKICVVMATITPPMSSSATFKGKTRVQQHKMVYDALQGRMGGELHALALQTSVPKDA